MYLSRREKDFIASMIAATIFLGTISAGAAASVISYNNETKSTMSSEVGFEVVKVEEAEISQAGGNYRATIKCRHKETNQPSVVEYKLTATDFIVMNQKDTSAWEYLSRYIIPNQDPSFVGTVEEYNALKNQKPSSSTPEPGE